MARILVNYIYNKQKDEFKILDGDCVYADQKVAILETEEIINKPLVVPFNNVATVVDRERYEQVHKRFYLVANEKGEVKEDRNGTEIWLPKDTDISKLRLVNGRLVMVEEPKEEKKEQKNTQPKSKNKKLESEAQCMAYPDNPYPASYKVYNGSNWIEYYFRTSADLVGETSGSDPRKFVSNKVYVNGVAFAFSSLPTQGAVAEVTITGSNIVGNATPMQDNSLHYLSANDSVASALGKLDKYCYDASQSVPANYLVSASVSGNTLTISPSSGNDITFSDTDTTYTLETGTSNGKIKVTPSSGSAYEVSVYGLGSGAFRDVVSAVTQNSADLVTSGAVWTAISNLPTPMQFKGTVGTGGTIAWSYLESASGHEGWTYKVIENHSTAPICSVGDTIVSNGSEWVVIPSGDDTYTDTWRAISVNGTQLVGNGISSGGINFVNGGNITLSGSGNNITLGVASGYSIPSDSAQATWSAKQDALGYTPVDKAGDTMSGDLTISKSSPTLKIKNTSTGATAKSVGLTLTGFDLSGGTLQSGYQKSLLFPTPSHMEDVEMIATQNWVDSNFSRCQAGTSFSGTPSTGDIWIDTN